MTPSRYAAIHRQYRAGNPGRFAGGQEQNGPSDVRRLAIATQRMKRVKRRQHLPHLPFIHERAIHRRFDHRRGHGVDTNVVGSQFDRQVAGQCMHAGIRCRVRRRRCGTNGLDGPQGTGLHNGATTTLQHGFCRSLGHEEFALEDDIQKSVIFGSIHFKERLGTKYPGVIHQHIHTAKTVHCLGNQRVSGRRVGDVTGHCTDGGATGINRVRRLVQFDGVTSPDYHTGTFFNEVASHFLADGFERLRAGLARLKDAAHSAELTVTVSPAFAGKWLLPRLERFQQAYPHIDVLLNTQLKTLDFRVESIDIGVRYGAGSWAGLTSIKLMDEDLFPVCAPNYAPLRNGRLKLAQLAQCTLIHDLSMAGDSSFPTWRSWLDAMALSTIDASHGLRVNNSAAVVQAAIEGQGVALGRSVMVHDDLASGRLIRPLGDATSPLSLAYYVVYRPECSELEKVQAFRDWLLAESRP